MDPVTIKAIMMALQTVKNSKPLRYFIIGLIIVAVCFMTYGMTIIISVVSIFGSTSLSVSSSLISFIENEEGFSAVAYQGVDYQNYTIGYGHVIEPGETFTTLTNVEGELLLTNDLTTYVASVKSEFQNVILSQNQFDALVSLCYNLGPNIWGSINLTNDIKSSATADVIQKDFESLDNVNGVAVQGLLNRRNAEFEMFEYGIYEGVTVSSSEPE